MLNLLSCYHLAKFKCQRLVAWCNIGKGRNRPLEKLMKTKCLYYFEEELTEVKETMHLQR